MLIPSRRFAVVRPLNRSPVNPKNQPGERSESIAEPPLSRTLVLPDSVSGWAGWGNGSCDNALAAELRWSQWPLPLTMWPDDVTQGKHAGCCGHYSTELTR